MLMLPLVVTVTGGDERTLRAQGGQLALLLRRAVADSAAIQPTAVKLIGVTTRQVDTATSNTTAMVAHTLDGEDSLNRDQSQELNGTATVRRLQVRGPNNGLDSETGDLELAPQLQGNQAGLVESWLQKFDFRRLSGTEPGSQCSPVDLTAQVQPEVDVSLLINVPPELVYRMGIYNLTQLAIVLRAQLTSGLAPNGSAVTGFLARWSNCTGAPAPVLAIQLMPPVLVVAAAAPVLESRWRVIVGAVLGVALPAAIATLYYVLWGAKCRCRPRPRHLSSESAHGERASKSAATADGHAITATKLKHCSKRDDHAIRVDQNLNEHAN